MKVGTAVVANSVTFAEAISAWVVRPTNKRSAGFASVGQYLQVTF